MMRSTNEPSSSSSPSTSLVKYEVVISGGGPSALADAWEALKSGKSVLIVSNRDMNFSRVQRVSLFPENKKYLLDMLKNDNGEFKKFTLPQDEEDIKFVLEIIHSASIAVKDVERFLKRRMDELNTREQLSYIEKSEIKTIDMAEGIASIGPKTESFDQVSTVTRQVQFDYIVCADGASHHAINVLNNWFATPRIKHTPLAKPNHPSHASAYITIERKDGEDLLLPPNKQVIANSDDLTWILTFDPLSKTFANKKKIKCFFNGEVPQEIFNSINDRNLHLNDQSKREAQEQAVMEYVREIVQRYFHKANLNNGPELVVKLGHASKENESKDKLKLQAYRVEPLLASQAAFEFNGKKFLATGDAIHGSNYQFGYGLNNAFDHARKVGEVFRGVKSARQYFSESECNSFLPLANQFMTRLTNLRLFRGLLGGGIEDAIEGKRNEFLTQHATIIAQLREQDCIREAEGRLNLSGTRFRAV